MQWPLRFPDLSSLDFLKYRVYATQPASLQGYITENYDLMKTPDLNYFEMCFLK